MLLDSDVGIDSSHASNVASAFSSLARNLRAQEPYLVLFQSVDDHTVDLANSQAVGLDAPSFRVIWCDPSMIRCLPL